VYRPGLPCLRSASRAFLACKPFLTPETGRRYTSGSRHLLSRSSVPDRLEIDGFDVKILKEIIMLRKQD
jgi:hypothetical protein